MQVPITTATVSTPGALLGVRGLSVVVDGAVVIVADGVSSILMAVLEYVWDRDDEDGSSVAVGVEDCLPFPVFEERV